MELHECTNAENDLYRMMTTGRNIEAIVKKASAYLGNPIVVPDATGGIIAASTKDYIDDAIWNNLFIAEDAAEMLVGLSEDELLGAKATASENALLFEGPKFEHRWLYANARARYYRVASVCLLEYDRPFEENDRTLLECLATIIGYRYEHEMHWKREANYDKREVLIKMLSGAMVDPVLHRAIYHDVDFSLPVEYRVVAMQPLDFVAKPTEMVTHQRWFEQHVLGAVGVAHQGLNVLFIVNNTRTAIASVVAEPPEMLDEYARSHDLLLGTSRRFFDIGLFMEHYWQAVMAMRFARIDPERNCLAFDRCWRLNIFETLAAEELGDTAMWGKVVDIKNYDARESTHCLDDLTAYLTHGCSYVKTSEILGVHRNTVKYRIERIAELFGLDFDDDDQLFDLMLSVRMHEYMQARSAYEDYIDAVE